MDSGLSEARGPDVRARRNLPTQAIVLALVSILVIPGIAFSGLLLWRYAEAEQARNEQNAIAVARAAATAIDRHITSLHITLRTLTTSHFLAVGDLAAFHDQAQKVRSFIDADLVLRRADGQQLINTRVPFGTVLPSTPYAVDAIAISTGAPVITDVFFGAISNRSQVGIMLPVSLAGQPGHLLHISAETDRFHEVIKEVTPSDWVVGVADGNGTYVTRSENHAEFAGKPGIPAFLARASEREGDFLGENPFGEKILVGYTRPALANWLVAASIRQTVLEAPLWRALYAIITFGVATLAISSLIAIWLWRFVARPLDGLARASRRVGSEDASFDVPTSLREFVAVRDALALAHHEIRSHATLLESRVAERTYELAQANSELTQQMAAREKAEAELRQVHKMEAVGQLTGGIAHDFNNMLTVIISSLGLLQRRLDRGEIDIQRYVDSAREGATRASALTSRLLAFSRQQPLAPEVLDANRLVAGMAELLQRTLGEAIRIETVLAAGLWRTHADAAQLENAILNLCVNARDAMPDGGRLTIETGNAHLDEAYADAHESVTPGQYVMTAITDTGQGMTPDVVARAFDPFFTTKRAGMGTGLGLSQVYGFVKQSKGHIKIYSEPGHGTTVKIYLMRYYGDDEAKALRREAQALPAGQASDVILVVEDEDRLRTLTVETLRELGYTVLDANGAGAALALVARHPEIALLFTDIVMPDVNGRQLADQVVKLRPGIKVLFTTGFTRNAVVHNGILDTGVNFIPKPFSMEDLATKIRQVLSDPA